MPSFQAALPGKPDQMSPNHAADPSAYDRSLLKPIVDWVNSDRSDRGNAHRYRESDATKADAWLAIHVAGALMVRLSNEEPRDIIAARDKRVADALAVKEEEERRVAAEDAAEAAARSAATEQWNSPWSAGNYTDETPF